MIVDDTFETASSLIAFGRRTAAEGQRETVVLKVIRRKGDEWHSGAALRTFNGHGVARVYEHAPGAVLLERLSPGTSLVEMSLDGKDAEATEVLIGVIQQMSISALQRPNASIDAPTLWDWSKGFDRYVATGDDQVPASLVASARRLYTSLCGTQREPRLLHGDLQHYNVLFDSERGWLAVDPKGVRGELEYEIGAILRNPVERLELFTSTATIQRRTRQFVDQLSLDYERILAWAFAQAVLSAIWDIEDGFPVDPINPALKLAIAIQPMLANASPSSDGI